MNFLKKIFYFSFVFIFSLFLVFYSSFPVQTSSALEIAGATEVVGVASGATALASAGPILVAVALACATAYGVSCVRNNSISFDGNLATELSDYFAGGDSGDDDDNDDDKAKAIADIGITSAGIITFGEVASKYIKNALNYVKQHVGETVFGTPIFTNTASGISYSSGSAISCSYDFHSFGITSVAPLTSSFSYYNASGQLSSGTLSLSSKTVDGLNTTCAFCGYNLQSTDTVIQYYFRVMSTSDFNVTYTNIAGTSTTLTSSSKFTVNDTDGNSHIIYYYSLPIHYDTSSSFSNLSVGYFPSNVKNGTLSFSTEGSYSSTSTTQPYYNVGDVDAIPDDGGAVDVSSVANAIASSAGTSSAGTSQVDINDLIEAITSYISTGIDGDKADVSTDTNVSVKNDIIGDAVTNIKSSVDALTEQVSAIQQAVKAVTDAEALAQAQEASKPIGATSVPATSASYASSIFNLCGKFFTFSKDFFPFNLITPACQTTSYIFQHLDTSKSNIYDYPIHFRFDFPKKIDFTVYIRFTVLAPYASQIRSFCLLAIVLTSCGIWFPVIKRLINFLMGDIVSSS